MGHSTGRWDSTPKASHDVRGLVAVVGARNLVSERLKTALSDRFSFEFLDTPSTVVSMPDAMAQRPSLYVVNCYRAFDVGATVRKSEDKRRRGSADAFDEWTQWIAELQRRDPNVPIVVALNEQHDSAMVGRAVAAGADEVIGAAVADVPRLVRQRVWSLLLETDRELADSLWDHDAIAVAPMIASHWQRPRFHSRLCMVAGCATIDAAWAVATMTLLARPVRWRRAGRHRSTRAMRKPQCSACVRRYRHCPPPSNARRRWRISCRCARLHCVRRAAGWMRAESPRGLAYR
jgi:hypothetical protein